MSFLWNPVPTPTFSANGQFASGAQVFFYVGGTSTPLVVYADDAFSQALPVPVIADQNGVFQPIYIPYGPYRRRIQDQNGVLLSDADNIDNFAPPTSGGSGLVVTQDMVFQTGYPVWLPTAGIRQGWIRSNGNTIGSALSGASELASSACANLYSYLWSNFADAKCPVTGGRGSNPTADFGANKPIGSLKMQGLCVAGLDDMGATAGSILQAVTTCTTNGTTTVVVVSAAGIAVGDSAIVNGISVGPIVSISGTTVILTSVAAGSASGISFRSSRFADAQIAGSIAGIQNVIQTSDNLAAHGHAITDPGHQHLYDQAVASATVTGGVVFPFANVNFGQPTQAAVTGITIANAGGGNPLSILQPTILGTWYMKL
jgi:hypothetical protein